MVIRCLHSDGDGRGMLIVTLPLPPEKNVLYYADLGLN